MTKFLLAVLMAALVSGTVHGEGVAGESPPATEPGIFSQIAETVDEGCLRVKGMVMMSQVKRGMTRGEVRAILGDPRYILAEDDSALYFFGRSGVWVIYSKRHGAGGGQDCWVSGVYASFLFK